MQKGRGVACRDSIVIALGFVCFGFIFYPFLPFGVLKSKVSQAQSPLPAPQESEITNTMSP